jgi:hypothetical protein
LQGCGRGHLACSDEEQAVGETDVRSSLVTIGRWEWVALPGLLGERLRAKVDTGAATSALHAFDARIVDIEGATTVTFQVIDGHPPVTLTVENFTAVRSSNGEREVRPVVLVPLQVAGRTFNVLATLTDRSAMRFPVLLGRSTLAGRFVVDPGRRAIHPRPKLKAAQ